MEIVVNSYKKVQVGNDQEKAQSERNSNTKNRGGKNQIDNNAEIISQAHYENLPMQYTEIFSPVKIENFQWKFFDIFQSYFCSKHR